jgi:RNA polymerase sigma-70 factor (ECF subfamily)
MTDPAGTPPARAGATRRFTRTPDAVSGQDGLVMSAVRRAQQGDTNALHFLYVRYADDVYGFVNSLVRDHHDAEDITQSLFAKLMRIIGKYEQREVPFSAWILRVARNAALDHMRAHRQIPCEQALQDALGKPEAPSASAGT